MAVAGPRLVRQRAADGCCSLVLLVPLTRWLSVVPALFFTCSIIRWKIRRGTKLWVGAWGDAWLVRRGGMWLHCRSALLFAARLCIAVRCWPGCQCSWTCCQTCNFFFSCCWLSTRVVPSVGVWPGCAGGDLHDTSVCFMGLEGGGRGVSFKVLAQRGPGLCSLMTARVADLETIIMS